MSLGSQPTCDVFLSYSSHDKHWADAACAVLEGRRIRCWIAPRDIAPGTEWGASIIHGIDACRIMVLIFSAHANGSAQVRREVERAISKGLIVLPFRVENVTPAGAMEYALGNTHWLDGFTPPVEQHLEVLAHSVETLLNQDRGILNTPVTLPSMSNHSPAVNTSPHRDARLQIAWKVAVGMLAVMIVLFAVLKRNSDIPLVSTTTSQQATASTGANSEIDKSSTRDEYMQVVLNGIWNGSSGSIFTMDATLEADGPRLSGKIRWKLVQIPNDRGEFSDRLGEGGIEEIVGTIKNTELEIAGISVSETWLGRGIYRVQLDKKAGTFTITNNAGEAVSGSGKGTFVFVK